ncbi:MAG: hypothetical protein LH650_16310, partial [Chloroflexi bacterium]|nr:hypothetical protein [Chloroflexota bacterium]
MASVSLTFTGTSQPYYCSVIVNAVALTSSSTLAGVVTVQYFGDTYPISILTDSNGDATVNVFSFGNQDRQLDATVDGVSSGYTNVVCSATETDRWRGAPRGGPAPGRPGGAPRRPPP